MKKLSLIILSALAPLIANANNETEEPSVLEPNLCEVHAELIEYAEQYMSALLETVNAEATVTDAAESELVKTSENATAKDEPVIELAFKE